MCPQNISSIQFKFDRIHPQKQVSSIKKIIYFDQKKEFFNIKFVNIGHNFRPNFSIFFQFFRYYIRYYYVF